MSASIPSDSYFLADVIQNETHWVEAYVIRGNLAAQKYHQVLGVDSKGFVSEQASEDPHGVLHGWWRSRTGRSTGWACKRCFPDMLLAPS